MARVTVTMPEDTRLAVARRAQREGKSFSAMAAELIERELIDRGLMTVEEAEFPKRAQKWH
jgi:hypothetical protein